MTDLKSDLKELVRPHLTDKSLGRIDYVLDFFSQVTPFPHFSNSLKK